VNTPEEAARAMVYSHGPCDLDGPAIIGASCAVRIAAAAFERGREEGAADERERIFAAAKDKPADLAAMAMAVSGVRSEADYARARIAEIEEQESLHRAALARSREANYADALYAVPQSRDLAGSIRLLVSRYTDIWLALGTWDPEGEAAVAGCLAILRGILRVERGVLGVDSTQALLERARRDAASMPESLRGRMLTRLVAEVETIIRECEAQR
jgi:hypothetical protein